MSTLQATNLKNAASASNNIVLDASGNATFAGTAAMASSFLRNRIINGAMEIDQRNAGASGTASAYTVDRWVHSTNMSLPITWQQNAGSVTPPPGFTNYLGFTSSGTNSPSAGQFSACIQGIEGFNSADLGWGSAGAQPVTLSFWARSSLTGTFSGSIYNGGGTRSYPFTYTITAANTWEYKTVTIPGETSGLWATNNSIGIAVHFSLSAGSSVSGTAGVWATSIFRGATGAVNVTATSGATLYLTGVQLEVGTAATPFERRQYGQELALCQRYYEKSYAVGTVPGTNTAAGLVGGTAFYSNARVIPSSNTFRVTKRAAPTLSYWDRAGNSTKFSNYSAGSWTDNVSPGTSAGGLALGENNFLMYPGTGYTQDTALFHFTAASEL